MIPDGAAARVSFQLSLSTICCITDVGVGIIFDVWYVECGLSPQEVDNMSCIQYVVTGNIHSYEIFYGFG